MRVDLLTIFPDYFAPLDLSLVGKARRSGLLDVAVHDLRQWTTDRHRSVDDTPYGGGAGMVMRPDVWTRALTDIRSARAAARSPLLLVPTPSGRRLDQAWVRELAGEAWLVLACGRYEGIDARVVEAASPAYGVAEVSVGDYVLAGGEAAALVILEAVTRLLPGVLGNPASLTEESHDPDAGGLLEYPVYTKPPVHEGLEVPAVLLSGDHARIARWRRDQALRRTATHRPDLLTALDPDRLDAADHALLRELGWLLGPDGRFSPARSAVAD